MKQFPSDNELWKDFKQGNSQAFGTIYERNISELLSYGYRISSDRQLIKDSIHDLFLYLWQHKENLADTDSIKFYLFRSLRNRMLQNFNSNKEMPERHIEDLIDQTFSEPTTEQAIISFETQQYQIRTLKCAIEKLPERQREAIQLRYFHDFSMEEIAELMQLNSQSLRNLLHRSMTHLRGFFEMAGWSFFLTLQII